MLNNKGFTIVEVVISFTFVVIILASMFAVVINYQNDSEKQQLENDILVFRNSVLQIIYNDIIGENMENMTSCGDRCVDINTTEDVYKIEGITDDDGNQYLSYRGTRYLLPDSANGLSRIDNFVYDFDITNKIYYVKIPLIHAEMTDEENKQNSIELIVSGKKLNKE